MIEEGLLIEFQTEYLSNLKVVLDYPVMKKNPSLWQHIRNNYKVEVWPQIIEKWPQLEYPSMADESTQIIHFLYFWEEFILSIRLESAFSSMKVVRASEMVPQTRESVLEISDILIHGILHEKEFWKTTLGKIYYTVFNPSELRNKKIGEIIGND
ncbi:hypothetical protein EBU71_12320 [bacterium]|nr:hypothetical protein [Candidatus Elulimicrobium humile]